MKIKTLLAGCKEKKYQLFVQVMVMRCQQTVHFEAATLFNNALMTFVNLLDIPKAILVNLLSSIQLAVPMYETNDQQAIAQSYLSQGVYR